MKIIAFAGQARCGKTTFAKSFARAAYDRSMSPTLRSFAGPLKQAAAEAGFDKDTHPTEYREFCQIEGAVKRFEDHNYWVDLFHQELRQLAAADAAHLAKSIEEGTPYHETVVLVDDLRYENEYELVRKLGGQIILILRDELPEANAAWRGHDSEDFANYWVSASEEEQGDMFDMVMLNDVPSEQAVMKCGKMLFFMSELAAMDLDDKGRPAIDEEELDVAQDEDASLTDLLDLFRKLKRKVDDSFGLEEDDDPHN
jgi:hypothetical protein